MSGGFWISLAWPLEMSAQEEWERDMRDDDERDAAAERYEREGHPEDG